MSMRDFRAAPAKVLQRAARTGASLRLGRFVVTVQELEGDERPQRTLHGAMASTIRVVDPSLLLSADDVWDQDG
jgi:hypothetical protein